MLSLTAGGVNHGVIGQLRQHLNKSNKHVDKNHNAKEILSRENNFRVNMKNILLEKFYSLALKRGKLMLIIMVVLTIIMGCFIPTLSISSSRKKLISSSHPEQVRYLQFMDEFGTADNLIVILEGDTETLKSSADIFADELLKEKKYVNSVFYKMNVDILIDHALMFIPTDELKTGIHFIKKEYPMIKKISRLNNLMAILKQLQAETKFQDVKINPEAAPVVLNGMNAFFKEWRLWIEDPSRHSIKVLDKLMRPGSQEESVIRGEGYLFSRDFRMLFLFIQPTSSNDETSYLRPFMNDIKKVKKRVFDKYPKLKNKIKVSFTGMPAHILTENETIISDVSRAGSISTFCVIFILLFGFRSIKKMIIGVIPLFCGMVITLGIIALTIGRLNLISSAFMAVLFGIGIDFGIYLIRRTEEEMGNGVQIEEAIHISVVKTGKGIITGGLTTGLAFLAITFSDFTGYSELGISAGIGVIIVLLSTFIMMPALMLLIKVEPRKDKLYNGSASTEKNQKKTTTLMAIIIPSAIIAIFGIFSLFNINMDYNVLKLLPKDTESTIYQIKMEKESDYNMSSAAITTDSFEKLKDITKKLEKLPIVSRIDSLASLIPDNQKEKIDVISKVKPEIANLKILYRNVNYSGENYSTVLKNIILFFENIQDKAFAGGRTKLVKKIEEILQNLKSINDNLTGNKTSYAIVRTKDFEKELFRDLGKMIGLFHAWSKTKPITEDILPKKIINRFKSSKGTYVAYVYPKGSIWDLDVLDKFVTSLKENAANVTGFPVTHRVYIRLAADAVLKSMIYSIVIIIFLLMLDFRRLDAVALALIPLVVGMLWLQGVFFIGGFSYNVANIAGLPLLLGLGVVYGVHIVHRWLENKNTSAFAAAHTTGRGVAFAAFTTITGLFSIVFARHGGASTFGIVLMSGILLCLITALIILPAIIDLIFLRNEKNSNS